MTQVPGQEKLSKDRRLDIIEKWMREHYCLEELNKDQLKELDFRVYEKSTPKTRVAPQRSK